MTDSGTSEHWSRRAQILKRVLAWINQDRCEDYGSWMLFGAMGADTGIEPPLLYRRDGPEAEHANKAVDDVVTWTGRVFDELRTSLSSEPPKLNILGAETINSEIAGNWGSRRALEGNRADDSEYLDAKYSEEVVAKLEKIVRRAALLNAHEIDTSQIDQGRFRECFQEAHRCYLYGFNRACAVMCRALVESALKERFDPFHKIENKLPKGHSLFKKLIEVAKLDDPLPERAERIKDCGDWAAHSDSRFEKECESRSGVEDNLDWTRAILAALYPKDR